MLIQIQALSHVYMPGTPLAHVALSEVDLEIGPGQSVGIVGPTGSGKSTLVQLIAGLLKPSSGQVALDGIAAHERKAVARAQRRRVGLAFQYPEDQIFEQTVYREVAFGPQNLGLAPADVASRVHGALEMVGLDPAAVEQRMPLTLSGGEMRRVALASVLSMRPEVLILDEPTAGLDPQGRHELIENIRSWPDAGLTLILVSHDLDELARLVERVLLLDAGRIVADGPARQILGDAELLRASGLDVPQPVALLRALQVAGWPVRTDRLLPEEAAAEIARAASAQHGTRGRGAL